MILSFEGMVELVSQVLGQVSISAFKNVLNIGFYCKDRVYLSIVLQSQQASSCVINIYQLKFGQLIESLRSL